MHQFMSGRIKLLQNGVPVNEADEPPLVYEYDVPGSFDEQCGTFALDAFQLPHPQCPSTFICGTETVSAQQNTDSMSLETYTDCLNSMNCAMFVGMSNGVSASSPVALFIHQMVPHHQNAVNMAKLLLKSGKLQCDDLTAETTDCVMEVILRSIINGQNMEIQQMRGVLKSKGYPETDSCVVTIDSSEVVKRKSRKLRSV
jgi:hypothetical protein